MACRGVHFALSPSERKKLLAVQSSDKKVLAFVEAIEGRWDQDWVFETDKAWDALHRCLTDGALNHDNGEEPLKRCFLGGVQLHSGAGYIVSVATAKQVREIATALATFDKRKMRRAYRRIDPDDYWSTMKLARISDEDFEYVWSQFKGLPQFFARAAAARRDVIFTVDA